MFFNPTHVGIIYNAIIRATVVVHRYNDRILPIILYYIGDSFISNITLIILKSINFFENIFFTYYMRFPIKIKQHDLKKNAYLYFYRYNFFFFFLI